MSILSMRVLEAAQHENADKLRVYSLEGGLADGPIQVIANCDNVYEVGDLVAVATVGTTLSDGTEIQKAKFRGVRSFGMCLGKTEAPLGTDLTASFGATSLEKVVDPSTGLIEDSNWPRYTSIEVYLKLREDILKVPEVVVLEKSHGSNIRFGYHKKHGYCFGTHTSRIVESRLSSETWKEGELIQKALLWAEKNTLQDRIKFFRERNPDITSLAIFGEVMGFKCSDLHYGMKHSEVRLFGDVAVNGKYLNFDDAIHLLEEIFPGENVVMERMVPILYRGPPTTEVLKKCRDLESTLALNNGSSQISEGIVIRPTTEIFSETLKDRLIAKWKGPLYCERRSLRNADPDTLPQYLTAWDLIFDFITAERVIHVWQRAKSLGFDLDMRNINLISELLLEDIVKESKGEWPDSFDPQKNKSLLARCVRGIANDLIASTMQDLQIGMIGANDV